MCLYPIQPLKIEIASTDIACYKTLLYRPSDGAYISLVMDEPYRRGEIKRVEAFCADEAHFDTSIRFTTAPAFPVLRVGEGLHAMSGEERALRGNYRSRLDSITIRVAIPVGTPYIQGTEGDIVSLCLRVEDALSGPPSHVEAFNRRQVTYESSN